MPRGDRTGPHGEGPVTGRGAGYCSGYAVPGYLNPARANYFEGRGMGRGFARGLGRGSGFFRLPYGPAPEAEQELNMLRGQAQRYQKSLQEINNRISELETGCEETDQS